MAVLYLTKSCTLKCDYCFDKVQQEKAKEQKNVFISDDMFKLALKRALETYKDKPISERSICLSWGEPTLHPKFKEYVIDIIRSWMKVHLLSNFSFSEDICNFIKARKKHFSYMVNINDPKNSQFNWMNDYLWNRTLKNLEVLQDESLQLSLNVWNPSLDYDYIFDVLDKYPLLDKRLRIWIINPIVSEIKETVFDWMTWIKYKMLWKKIDQIVEKTYEKGYTVFMDCWAWYCVFSDKTKNLVLDNWEWNKCTLPIPWIKLNGAFETCYVMVDAFNEDQKLNIQNNSISQYVTKGSMKTEFYKNYHLTLPKCQSCPQFYKCHKFCTSNNYFYWWKFFKEKTKEDIENLITENISLNLKKDFSLKDRDSNIQINLLFSIIEYYISKDKFQEAFEYVLFIKEKITWTTLEKILINKINTYFYFLWTLGKLIDKPSAINHLEQLEKIDDLYTNKLAGLFMITLKKRFS